MYTFIGHRIFPSVVAYKNNGDVAAVAHDAIPYLSLRPENTIFNAKRFIGGDLNDSATQIYANAHPYKVVTSNISKHTSLGMYIYVFVYVHIYVYIYIYMTLLLRHMLMHIHIE
jgi:molecular chaperone DnaK (HSP70)